MTQSRLNRNNRPSPFIMINTKTGEIIPPRPRRATVKLKSEKGRVVRKGMRVIIEEFSKSEQKIIMNIIESNFIDPYNIFRAPFKFFTQNMKTSNRSKLKKKLIRNGVIYEYNKKLMFSPEILIPKARDDYDTGSILQYVWYYITGSEEWKKLSSGDTFRMFSLKQKIFNEEKKFIYNKDIESIDSDLILSEREAVLPDKSIITYSEYMNSNEWNQVRKQRIELDGFKCVKCGSDIQLEVHHLSYDNLGHEPMEDLQTLCSYCHYLEHKEEF